MAQNGTHTTRKLCVKQTLTLSVSLVGSPVGVCDTLRASWRTRSAPCFADKARRRCQQTPRRYLHLWSLTLRAAFSAPTDAHRVAQALWPAAGASLCAPSAQALLSLRRSSRRTCVAAALFGGRPELCASWKRIPRVGVQLRSAARSVRSHSVSVVALCVALRSTGATARRSRRHCEEEAHCCARRASRGLAKSARRRRRALVAGRGLCGPPAGRLLRHGAQAARKESCRRCWYCFSSNSGVRRGWC